MTGVVRVTGVVSVFDAHRGRGEVEAETGERYGFHCASISDGSRTIAPGARVAFEVAPGPRGRWEARAISAR